jgi:hypothetical protein
MKHPPILGLALVVAFTGCVVGDVGGPDDDFLASAPVDCTGLDEWAQGTRYTGGDVVTDGGDAFQARVSHTAFAANWNPRSAASLWLLLGPCADGGDAPPPPGGEGDEAGGGGDEQIPPPAPGCAADGSPGPRFDPAGVPNVGNGNGEQFIGGQCLDASDCASGCCAKPCGICSGPGAQFQNGKQGCGFGD